MRIVIFSDVHGNVLALKEFIKKEQNYENDLFVFCGDICGYYYEIDECVDILSSIPNLVAVRGNHDQYYVDAFNDSEMTHKLIMKYGSIYNYKSRKVLSFIKSMPLNKTIDCGDVTIHIQHGTPNDFLEGRVYPDTPLPYGCDGNIFIAGHTHYRLYKKDNNIVWINPGSLGQPRDGKGFSYCVMDTKEMVPHYKTVRINIDSLVKNIRKNDPENKYLEEILYRQI